MIRATVAVAVVGWMFCVGAPAAGGQQPRTSDAELVFWQSIADSMDPGDFEAYLERFPEGVFSGLARRRLEASRELEEFVGELLSPLIGGLLDGGRIAAEASLDRSARQRVQRRLQDEGFDPGIPDGLFGPRTRAAIREWQQSRGAPQTGYLDGAEALELTGSAERPATGGDVVRSEFFTRGSHADDVLRIQGTPTRISTRSDSEVWGYGLSTVTISTSSREVTEWWNSGNLRVRLEPRETELDGGAEVFGDGDHVRVSPPIRDKRVYEVGDGVVAPRVLREVTPRYTAEAMRAKVEGTVLVEAIVLVDGSVGNVTVIRSLEVGLDEEAIKAARSMRFEPGTRLGEPVAFPVTLEFSFTLR